MRRRAFLRLIGAAAAWPFAAAAQQTERIARIGYLAYESPAANGDRWRAFLAGLHDFGYVEGKNIRIDLRYAGDNFDRFSDLTKELIEHKVDVLVAYGPGVYAAARVTTTVPIVAATAGDVVAMGIVASLAHPGGNVTGSTIFLPELMAKRLELLKQAEPSMTSAGVLLRRDIASTQNVLEVMGKSAKALRVELRPIEIGDPGEFENAFSAWNDQKTDAVVVPDQFLAHAATIAALAMKYRMATVSQADWATKGGLIGYGPDINAMFRRAAYFIDKILKGVKPGDIPIEQATKFTTIVNLKTAHALGLDIPPAVLAAADEVIE